MHFGKIIFSANKSPSNFIRPGKQPMSSMSPIIAVNKDTKEGKFIFKPGKLINQLGN